MMLMGAGLATSHILMSWGEIGLGIAFLWDGKFKEKWRHLKSNRRILSFILVYLIFLLGILHTSNFTYAFHDLKIKLPLLVVPPLAYACFPFQKRESKLIVHSVFAGILFTIVFGWMIYMGWIPWDIKDMRSYSPFISNVRLGTLLAFTTILSLYLIKKNEWRWLPKLFYLIFALVCLGFLFFIQSLTGIVALLGACCMLAIYALSRKSSRRWAIYPIIGLIVAIVGLSYITWKEYQRIHIIDQVDLSSLPKFTPDGNPYVHMEENIETTNGHFIYHNICEKEL